MEEGDMKEIISRTITLPGEGEIMERLRIVDMGPNNYMRDRFSRCFSSRAAGQRLNALGVAELFLDCVYEVSIPWPVMRGVLSVYVPSFIQALVAEIDEGVAEEAVRLHQEVIDNLCKKEVEV